MLSNQIIVEIRRDLNLFGGHDLLGIPVNQEEEFWNWFRGQAVAIPNSGQLSPDANSGKYHQGRCFGNAQSFSLEFNEVYFEGFVMVEASRHIHHGFIVGDNGVIDPTALTHPKGFVDQHGSQPDTYYGVEIPIAFYADQADIVNKTFAQTSFLSAYFTSIN